MEGTLGALGLTPTTIPQQTTNLSLAPNSLAPSAAELQKHAEEKGKGPEPEEAGPTGEVTEGNAGGAGPSTSQAVVPAGAAAAAEAEVDRVKHPSGIVPVLQNVVATVNLGVKLDLKNIALKARNAEYNPKRFAAVIMRIRDPKTTALIFASGKMVCTGAKSEEKSRLAARKYCRILQKLDYSAQFKEFKIQNIVGSCDVKFPIRLEGLSWSHSMFASYEPELFPGLIYRMKMPKIVLLIFVSGKVVLTGAKHRDEIYQAFEQIYPVLQEFRKGTTAEAPAAAAADAEGGQASALDGARGATTTNALLPS